jgi:hypothetical protein
VSTVARRGTNKGECRHAAVRAGSWAVRHQPPYGLLTTYGPAR